MKPVFKEVAHNSPAYWKLVDLRSEILRKPLGMVFTDEQLAAENDKVHLSLWENDEPVACLMLLPTDADGRVQMKQVAVKAEKQGAGIGKTLVWQTEAYARQQGAKWMFCHARETAVPFYLRMGYQIVGETFLEIGIPHFYMEKAL